MLSETTLAVIATCVGVKHVPFDSARDGSGAIFKAKVVIMN